MNTVTYQKQLPVKRHYDVIVCGGGVAGVAAAVSAAKNGCSTLLIEKSNILGGLGTLRLVNLFVPMCNGRGKQIIFGLCEKWVRLSARYSYDTIPEEWRDGEPKAYTEKRYMQRGAAADRCRSVARLYGLRSNHGRKHLSRCHYREQIWYGVLYLRNADRYDG